MNFLTLKNHLIRNLGGRKDIDVLVPEWLNSAYLDLVTTGKFPEAGKFAPIPIPELDGTEYIITGVGGTDYPVPVNFIFPVSLRDVTNARPLRYRNIRWYDRHRSIVNGLPACYAVYGGLIYIDPPSDGVYQLQLRFRQKVSVPTLVADADVPVVDEIWHEGIELCATYRGARSLQIPIAEVWQRDLKAFMAAHSEQTSEEEENADFGFIITM